MLYVCAVRFDVTKNFEKKIDFWGKLNKTLKWNTCASPYLAHAVTTRDGPKPRASRAVVLVVAQKFWEQVFNFGPRMKPIKEKLGQTKVTQASRGTARRSSRSHRRTRPPAASPPPPCTPPLWPRSSRARALAWLSSDLDLLGPRPSTSRPRRLDRIQTRSALAHPSRRPTAKGPRARTRGLVAAGGQSPEPQAVRRVAAPSEAVQRPGRVPSEAVSEGTAAQVRILSSFNCISVFIFFWFQLLIVKFWFQLDEDDKNYCKLYLRIFIFCDIRICICIYMVIYTIL